MKSIYRANLFFLIVFAVILTGAFFLGYLITAVPSMPHWARALLQYVLLFGLPSFLLMRWFHLSFRDVGFIAPPKPWITLPLIVLFAILIQPPLMLVSSWMEQFFPSPVTASMDLILKDSWPLMLLGSALLPAFFEEWICRGVFLSDYMERSSFWAAAASGLVFAMLHLNLQQFPYAFLFGFLISFPMIATGCVFLPMLAHFLINAMQLVTARTGFMILETESQLILVSLPCLIAAAGILFLLYRLFPRPAGRRDPVRLQAMLPLVYAVLLFILTMLLLR